jgi:hypothetical protein
MSRHYGRNSNTAVAATTALTTHLGVDPASLSPD